jgi:predicted N-formylglutamate amidohydrolase
MGKVGSHVPSLPILEPTRLKPNGAGPILFVCDHASNAIPEVHANLGLSLEQRADHIAWDPGAAGVTEALSDLLDCPAILARASRLLIDCNRHPADVDAIPEISETTSIPGNGNLSPDEVAARIEAYHTPFHAAIDQTRAELGPQIRAVVSLHSYVPVFHGQQRPWHLGLVYNADRRMADVVREGLSIDPDLVIGDNEPYSGQDRFYYTLNRHGQAHGLACLMIEIRNDLIKFPSDQTAWAKILAPMLVKALAKIP